MATSRRIIGAVITVIALMGIGNSSTLLTQTAQWDDQTTSLNTPFMFEDGRTIRLGDYHGNVIFLDFCGSWCTPCMLEMNSIKQLQDGLRNYADCIAYVLVSIKPGTYETDSAWFKQSGLVGANYRWNNLTKEQYHAFFGNENSKWYVPNTRILDTSGVAMVRTWGTDWSIHVDAIRNLLSAKSAAQ